MSTPTIKVKLAGGTFDGRTWQVEPAGGVVRIHMPVISDGGLVTEIYALTGTGADEVPVFEFRGILPPPAPVEEDETGPTSTALAAKAFLACIDNKTYRRIIETTAILGGWVGARGAGFWNSATSDAVVKGALDALWKLFRAWAAECGDVEPFDPELAAYLDWPLYFPDDSVHCDKFPACPNRDCRDPESGQVYLASARRMTIREFLADIKAHAEGK